MAGCLLRARYLVRSRSISLLSVITAAAAAAVCSCTPAEITPYPVASTGGAPAEPGAGTGGAPDPAGTGGAPAIPPDVDGRIAINELMAANVLTVRDGAAW